MVYVELLYQCVINVCDVSVVSMTYDLCVMYVCEMVYLLPLYCTLPVSECIRILYVAICGSYIGKRMVTLLISSVSVVYK